MGLVKNLRLLFDDDLLTRMRSLEHRQELLEDYTDQKLDSMKAYSARVNKRDRDAVGRSQPNDLGGVNGLVAAPTGNPRVDRILARRARRGNSLGVS